MPFSPSRWETNSMTREMGFVVAITALAIILGAFARQSPETERPIHEAAATRPDDASGRLVFLGPPNMDRAPICHRYGEATICH